MDTIEIIGYYGVYHVVENRYDKEDVICGVDLSEYDHEKWAWGGGQFLANLCRYPD